jgi:ankyrin repeat protein
LKSAGEVIPQIPGPLKAVIDEYLEEGFRWFVFDVVQLGTTPKTNEVIQYRFETPFLYYPLRITRTETGYTTIDLLILTHETEEQFKFTGIPEEGIEFPHEPIPLTREELFDLFTWVGDMERYSSFEYLFFYHEKPYLRIWRIEDYLSSFKKDLIVKRLDGSTALMDAAFMGSQTVAKRLIKQGVDVNEKDTFGNTALLYAAWQGQTEVAQLLIEAGADVNAQTRYGWTALMSAAYNGNVEFVQLLIDYGADVKIKNNSGDTALKMAHESGHTELAEILKHASEIVPRTKEMLFRAVMNDDVDEVKMLINKGADVNKRDSLGRTSLIFASKMGYTEIAQLLINRGSYINVLDNVGYTALMWASKMGYMDITELLINAGADINHANRKEYTALVWANHYGHTEVAKLLREIGVKE